MSMQSPAAPRRVALLAASLSVAMVVLAACQDPAAQAEARAAAQAQANEAAAEQAVAGFEAAYAAEHWVLAGAHGDVLLARAPGPAAPERSRPLPGDARANGKT